MSIRRTPLLGHPYFLHLRLGFNLLLSPIYLWGVLLADGTLRDADVWLGYLSLHLFLYGGTTAFNSYYDRDEGPIGGMLRPPPVDGGLLRFSLVVQALGLPLAAAVGPAFAGAWLLLFLVFAAYSHPAVRLKARPGRALAAIALGQGVLGFALGWLAARGAAGLLTPAAAAGAASTALIVTGLYLVTQSYQTAEDRARGDLTLPVLLGPRRALLVALALLAAGGALLAVWVWLALAPVWAALLTLFFLCLGGWLLAWALEFDELQVEGNFRRAMRFATISSGGLSLFLLLQLLAR